MAYGYEVHDGHDSYVDLVELAMDQFSILAQPGAFLVDIIPILRHVPAWYPGAGFRKTAQLWRKNLDDMVDIPYEFAKRRLVSFVSFQCACVSRRAVNRRSKMMNPTSHPISWRKRS